MNIMWPFFAVRRVAPALLFGAALTAAVAHADTPPYHVNDGYYGKTTISASGACGFKALVYQNTWFGEVFDSTDTSIGFGIITANGQLLTTEENFAPIQYRNNDDIGVGKEVAYTDMVGTVLVALIEGQSGCAIRTIVPNTGSRSTIHWDAMRALDKIQLRAKFNGFDEEVCLGPPSDQSCKAKKFSGAIMFSGNRATP
ncbi:MAG: hypothetical protein IT470_01690 [Pseudomonadales bacterium]|nr:hypothetical protein [Pseudomonadales bacterium]